MQPVQKRCQRGRELAHTAAIDEDLHQHCLWNLAQRQREDDGDAEHLARVIEHTENAGSLASHMQLNRTHDRIGVGRDEEAGAAAH